MSNTATELLKKIYISYNMGEGCYKMKAPISAHIHDFNMTLKEIEKYITFVERNMLNIKITLTDEGLEYCMDNFEI